MRTLVHAEIRAYAVPRAVHEVHALAPHRRACHRIELRARRRTWKAEVLQRQVTLQHQRVDVALAVADVAKSYCTGDIRCAVAVLCATVEQQQAFRFELTSLSGVGS